MRADRAPVKAAVLHPWLLRLAGVLAAAGSCVPSAGADDLLGEISRLARGGTPHLAVRIMDAHQPPADANPQAWARWERERIYIYEVQGDWPAVLARLRRVPRAAPRAFVNWAETTMARAEVEMGRGRQARERIARLIWGEHPEPLAESLTGWRRLIIRSYLAEGRVDNAQTAMLRYQLDYGDGSEEWRLLRARVLVRADRADEAGLLLQELESLDARVLNLLASSRSGHISHGQLRDEAKGLLNNEQLNAGLAYQLWGTLAESGRREGQGEAWIGALERAVALRHHATVTGSPIQPDADALWAAYETYAQELANEQQLLVGNFPAWFSLAESLRAKQRARARAVYGYLALNAGEPAASDEAHGHLVSLQEDDIGPRVLGQLYLQSKRFADVEAVPQAARYALVELATADGDIVMASRLIRGLEQAPPDTDAMVWGLRRARVLILGGQPGEGVGVLRELLAAQETLSPELVDRTNQVLFDLQTLGEHEVAYELFGEVLRRVEDPKARRELIFWMADSLVAGESYVEAARLYLKSAMMPGPHAMDPWAQTARYQAAEALAKAGLRDDARFLYEGLLAATEEPDRQAVLRRAIQQLWLVRKTEAVGLPTQEVDALWRN